MALHAYAALGCRGTARVDAMRDRDGRFLLLELNTLPGMTEHSFVPLSASVIGIGFDELVLRIIDQALPQVQLGESIHESS
jgi:D-alanine-D-alanine ligase